jgi:hypothetical protein
MSSEESKDSVLRFSDFGKVATGASGIALVLSVLYDYCFLSAMGLSLAEVPTTVADHVRSAIIWAPAVLGTLLLGAAWSAFMAWTAGSAKPPTNAPRHVRWLDLFYRYGIPVLFVPLAFLSATKFVFFVFLFVVVWTLGAPVVLNRIHQRLNFSLGFWVGCYALPFLAAMVCAFGHIKGTTLRDGKGDKWLVFVKDATGTRTVQSNGIRRFSESVVLVEPDRRVRVLPASEVVSAVTAETVPHSTRMSCEYFDVLCTPTSVESDKPKAVLPTTPGAASTPPAAPSSPPAASR